METVISGEFSSELVRDFSGEFSNDFSGMTKAGRSKICVCHWRSMDFKSWKVKNNGFHAFLKYFESQVPQPT